MPPSFPRPGPPGFIAHPITRGASYLCNAVASVTQTPAIAISRRIVLSSLSSIRVGTLILIDKPHGERHVLGQPVDESTRTADAKPSCPGNPDRYLRDAPGVTLRITSPLFYLRVFFHADMGFAQSYLLHEVEASDLTSFFRLFILNRAALNNGTTAASSWQFLIGRAISSLSSLTSIIPTVMTTTNTSTNTNTMSNALLNAAAHYDLGNDMFAAFLSPDMTYSCPIWELTSPNNTSSESEEELEQAQLRKLSHFIDGLHIKPTDHVLEIGTGWGSFAIEAVKRTGCRVTTLTLSREQRVLAEERIAREGLQDRVEVLLMDYRDGALPVPEGGYDKVVSIEMLEAVGREFLGVYFVRVDEVLKRDGGIAMFQCITMPEGRHEAYSRSEDFINRYIFPGGYLPSATQLLNHITAESKGTLIVERVENIGGHYARTLRLWRERFLANFESKIRPALETEHPNMAEEEVEVFRRKWEYYFSYCEAGFVTKTLGDVIITVGREGAMELMEGIPL